MSTAIASPTVEEVKDHALRLTRTARAYLAEVLIESLDEEDEVAPEVLAEVERRAADLDAGRAKTISGAEAIRRLRGE